MDDLYVVADMERGVFRMVIQFYREDVEILTPGQLRSQISQKFGAGKKVFLKAIPYMKEVASGTLDFDA